MIVSRFLLIFTSTFIALSDAFLCSLSALSLGSLQGENLLSQKSLVCSSTIADRRSSCRLITTRMASFHPSSVKAISLDVTGTILIHANPIMETYADAAVWARLPNPPTAAELKPAFKKAYFDSLTAMPCFGHDQGLSSRQWWVKTVRAALENTGRKDYTQDEFDRFFRRVYQHYGSLEGYVKLDDAVPFLDFMTQRGLTLGVTTNTPVRTMETVLPMNGFHDYFRWFVCSQDVGVEKPGAAIFQKAWEQAQFWVPGIKKEEILHIGDSLEADFCGARAFGFQALLLDRSDNPRVTVYQDWLEAPDYEGKSEADILASTIKDLSEVTQKFKAASSK